MKKINKFGLCLLVIIAFCNVTIAQTALGSSEQFLNNLKKDLAKSAAKATGSSISLKVDASKTFEAKVNYNKTDQSNGILVGEIKNATESTFYIKVQDKVVDGHIIFMASKEAYKYYSDDSGNVFINKVDINTIICVDYAKDAPQNAITEERPEGQKIGPELLKLQSFPGANGCIMLDFDGFYLPAGSRWNNGNPIDALPSRATDAQIQEQWEIVAEDYRAFSVNITTNEAVFNTYPKNRRMRVVVTPTNTAAPNGGGVAYVGSFNWNDDEPCWAFYNGKSGGECSSHEAGHTLGLAHDGAATTPAVEYYGGVANFPWAPIMGVSYYKPVTHWSIGEYNNANNKQDDLAIITNTRYGLGFRPDDYGNTTATASELAYNGNGLVTQKNGIISNKADIDFFSFTTRGGDAVLNAKTVTRHGDLDIIMKLYNSSGTEIGSFTDTANGALNATFRKTLTAGKYFISIDGTGSGDPASGGYSDYGSIGSYSITGTIATGNLGIDDVTLDATIHVFPNPFTTEINFGTLEKVEPSNVTLYDNLGRNQPIRVENTEGNKYKINTDALANGVYFLKINSDQNFKAVKIVKQ
jgi:Secretion system C-terminal sorting domain